MDTLLATCITMIFSGWVWNLKQEVSDLRSQVLAHPGEPAAVRFCREAHAEATAGHATAPEEEKRAHAGSDHKRREDGVPIWIIRE
jgi:hypothetical protein